MSNIVELVFVPAPGMGHMLSGVELAKLILKTNQLITISIHIINLPGDSIQMKTYLDSQTRDNPFPTRLTFVTFPPLSDPPDTSVPFSFITVIERHKPLIKQVIEDRIRDGYPKPAAFVMDMFCCGIMLDIGNVMVMDVPCYLFFSGGAASLSFIFHAQSLADDRGIDVASEFANPGFSGDVPGFKNRVPSKVIPSGYLDENFACEMLLDVGRKFREMKGILVNTYVELEPFPIHAFQNNDNKRCPTIYPVGPILELDSQRPGECGNEEKESLIGWLDGQPKSSVVFLCFGSMGCFEKEQVKEIAKGLEKSEHRFLWTLRKPPPVGTSGAPSGNGFLEALPKGFTDRTKHRGKIIGWAPQIVVLAHPAVGGFVSHCGWNSILESLWFGVPIATWPLGAEQQLNAFGLVKELELAVEIRMDYNRDFKVGKGAFLVTAEEIEEGVKNLTNMDEKMKERVKNLSEEGKKVLEKGGSSYKWLGCFIQDVFSNIV